MQTATIAKGPLRVAIIGAGSAKGQEYFEALSKRKDVQVVACVVNKSIPKDFGCMLIRDGNVDALLKEVEFDIAVVALPHNLHDPVTKALMQKGKRIIKEKPLALVSETAESYAKEIESKHLTPIFTTVQRGTHPLFQEAKNLLSLIGEIQSFTYVYTMDLARDFGWRAQPEIAGGGVVIDMGYHAIDQIVDFFGQPKALQAELGFKYDSMRQKKLEDSGLVRFDYGAFKGTMILDRHAEKKRESFRIEGSLGTLLLTPPTKIELFHKGSDEPYKTIEKPALSKLEIIQAMFDVALHATEPELSKQFQRNVYTMKIINSIYSNR